MPASPAYLQPSTWWVSLLHLLWGTGLPLLLLCWSFCNSISYFSSYFSPCFFLVPFAASSLSFHSVIVGVLKDSFLSPSSLCLCPGHSSLTNPEPSYFHTEMNKTWFLTSQHTLDLQGKIGNEIRKSNKMLVIPWYKFGWYGGGKNSFYMKRKNRQNNALLEDLLCCIIEVKGFQV